METPEKQQKFIEKLRQKEQSFKETVKPGDTVFAMDNKFYSFSEIQYRTNGKGYTVKCWNRDTVECDCDLADEKQYFNHLDISHVERNGKKIWESRNVIKWRYKSDLPYKKDCYGHKTTKRTYKGYYITHGRENKGVLVELIKPFRSGTQGQKSFINFSECEFIE